jgi:hypothetical protein
MNITGSLHNRKRRKRACSLRNQKPETDETAMKARFQEVKELRGMGWGKVKTIEKVWNAKPGNSRAYLAAEQEYEQFLAAIEHQEQRGA